MKTLPERVWLLRHAESAVPTVFHGAESDIALSELGQRQAEAAADWFLPLKPTAVVSSAMVRARSTAAPIARVCGISHTIEPELHERAVGDLGGTSFSLVEGAWVNTVRAWMAGDVDFTTPGAESFRTLTLRTVTAWDRVVTAHPGARLVVVAHGVVCKTLLLNLLEGWDVSGWERLGHAPNVSVTELVPSGNLWRAERLLEVPEPVAKLRK